MQGGHDFCYSHREYITVSRNRTAGDAERPTEEPWAAREQEDRERRRRANAAAWYAYHERMREMHARLAEEHEAAALALLGVRKCADDERAPGRQDRRAGVFSFSSWSKRARYVYGRGGAPGDRAVANILSFLRV